MLNQSFESATSSTIYEDDGVKAKGARMLTWLYFASRSDLHGAPVLIWPCQRNFKGKKDQLRHQKALKIMFPQI